MSKEKHRKNSKRRFGSRLKDGDAHKEMHDAFSRRDFMRTTGLLSVGTLMSVKGMAIHQLLPNALTNSLMNNDSDRVLVLIRLNGGNDGLNTVIDRGNDEYYNIRPTIAIEENQLWGLTDEIGMPNELLPLQKYWEGDRMKVIQNVGYPSQNYSHFRSSDIWASASDRDEYLETGWIGRLMDTEFPSFIETPPSAPPAIQIGIENNLIFSGAEANLSLAISNPTEFYRIAQEGQLYNTKSLNDCPAESELRFARQTANNAYRYSTSIQEAYQKGITKADYPNNSLAEQLSIVARLIKGNLGTRVYMVTIGGFDTHSDQADSHPILLDRIATSVDAFLQDLDADSWGDRVLGMTFSEFGRTVQENGSFGTDHGTGGPMMIFGGDEMGSGLVGSPPDLINLGQYDDPDFEIDFRAVYGSILGDWLGVDDRVLDHILGDQDSIDGLVPPANLPTGLNANTALLGYRKAYDSENFEIKYGLSNSGETKLSLLKLNGTEYRVFVEEFKPRGSYTFELNKETNLVENGSYLIELKTDGKIYRRHILIK